jgi:hypothetical protein
LIPHSTADRVWLVGGDQPEWFAPLDGATGELGEQTVIPNGFGWPVAGYDEGVLMVTTEPETSGPLVYWPQGGEPQSLTVDGITESTNILSVVGQAAVVSNGAELALVDLQTGLETVIPIPDGEISDIAIGACLNPDGSLVAATRPTGTVEVLDTTSLEPVGTVEGTGQLWGSGWTTPTQYVFITEAEGTTWLRALEVGTVSTETIARIAAPGTWRIATSGTSC